MSGRALAALALGLASSAVGCFPSTVPGTLPGEAQGIMSIENGPAQADSVQADGSPSRRRGFLTRLAYHGGLMFGITRFGTMSGVEFGLGAGWLSGDAASLAPGAEENSVDINGELGGTLQPLSVASHGAVVRLAGDFGVGFDRDDRYTYAGAELGGGQASRRWALDLGYRRHFGDVPGNPGAHEDHLRATVSFRPAVDKPITLHLGLELIHGDQRTLDDRGMEVARDSYLFRGRYDLAMVVIGVGMPRLIGRATLVFH